MGGGWEGGDRGCVFSTLQGSSNDLGVRYKLAESNKQSANIDVVDFWDPLSCIAFDDYNFYFDSTAKTLMIYSKFWYYVGFSGLVLRTHAWAYSFLHAFSLGKKTSVRLHWERTPLCTVVCAGVLEPLQKWVWSRFEQYVFVEVFRIGYNTLMLMVGSHCAYKECIYNYGGGISTKITSVLAVLSKKCFKYTFSFYREVCALCSIT